MNTNELCEYYAGLLILQYRGKPKAYAEMKAMAASFNMLQDTIEVVSLSGAATSGTLTLGYLGNDSLPIAWNASTVDIQTAIRSIAGLEDVIVTGSMAAGSFSVLFSGVVPPAAILYVSASTLETAILEPIAVTITETDVTMPVAAQAGYNLTETPLAAGVQLDVLGKYLGVARSGVSERGPFTLSEASFFRLILFAIQKRNMGGRLGEIAALLNEFFPGQAEVLDNEDMTLTFYLSDALYNSPTWSAIMAFDLVPRPMGVGYGVNTSPPVPGLYFRFIEYADILQTGAPFNDYTDYHTDWSFLSYTSP